MNPPVYLKESIPPSLIVSFLRKRLIWNTVLVSVCRFQSPIYWRSDTLIKGCCRPWRSQILSVETCAYLNFIICMVRILHMCSLYWKRQGGFGTGSRSYSLSGWFPSLGKMICWTYLSKVLSWIENFAQSFPKGDYITCKSMTHILVSVWLHFVVVIFIVQVDESGKHVGNSCLEASVVVSCMLTLFS